jgi:hypothetical protein
MKSILSAAALLFIFVLGCNKDLELPVKDYPYVETLEPEVTDEGTLLSAELMNIGNSKILQFGFVWSESIKPTILDHICISTGEIKKGKYTYQLNSGIRNDNSYYVRSYVKSENFLVYGNQISFDSPHSQQPMINHISPLLGSIGTRVIIDGENFSPYPEDNIVKFGDIIAVPDSVTKNKIVVKVPAITEPGIVTVSVETAGMLARSDKPFEMKFPWIKRADYNNIQALFHPGHFTFNNKGYMFKVNSDYLLEFNPETSTFSSNIKLPKTPENNNAVVTLSSSNGYVLLQSYLYRFDPATWVWELLDNYPHDRTYNDYSFYLNNEIYIGSGSGKSLVAYDENTHVWTEKKALEGFPEDVVYLNYSSYKNEGYILCGGLGIKSYIFKYDPINDLWSKLSESPVLPDDNTYYHSQFQIDDKIYVDLGNSTDTHYEKGKLWQYDISKNTWNQFHESPNRDAVIVNFVFDEKACILTEGQVYVTNKGQIWQFDPGNN